jgi:hypothetical protein
VSTIQVKPAEGAFYDPSFRQDFKSLCLIGSLDDLQGPANRFFEPRHKVSSVTTVGKYYFQASEVSFDLFDDHFRAVAILNIGSMNQHREDKSHGIHD